MRRSPPVAYTLDLTPGWLIATGPQAVVEDLAVMPGALVRAAGLWSVAIPADRAGFLAAEALAATDSASDIYRAARAIAMAPPPDHLAYVITLLCARGVDPAALLPHQLELVTTACWRRGIIDGSDRGTGKTRSALATMVAWGSRRAVVVCTKSAIGEWPAEAMNLAPGLERRFHRLDDGGRGRRGGRLELTVAQKRIAILEAADAPDEIVLVLNYEVLAALEPELRRFNPDFLVFDESWKLKAGRTQTSKAAAALAPLADQLLLLTGSAIGNNVGDLRSQLGLVSAAVPDLRHHADFMADYARTITIQDRDGHSWTKVIGVRQLPRLMAVMEPVWVRATKDVCLRLPPKRPTRVIEFEMPPVMRTLYDAVVRDGEAALGDPLSLASARVVALRLAQITGGHRPDLAPPTEEEEAEGIIRRGRARPIPLDCLKLTWLETIARDAWAGDPTHRVIIWCKHNAEVARIAAMLNRLLGAGRAAAITGATKNAEVDELKAAFNVRNPDGPQVLVCQILKMAFAHNLQAGDHHIYYSHTWSGLAKGQSADRSHRQGRELPIDYTSLVYRGTVEEMALHATDAKEDLNLRLSPVTHRQKIRGNNCQTSFN